ncbi:MAG: (Fe-S)-binding protein [Syntrophobacteraceae bacterium]|nr:(Fe-S)-binding protein [Syntrophobacteraceae bacterium]
MITLGGWGLTTSPDANKLINSCSLCGLCREVCPEDLHMGLVCRAAREELVRKGKMPPSAHDFPIRDMEFSNSDQFGMVRHEPGSSHSEFLFYPGCQLSASSPDQVMKVYAMLREKLSGGVGIALGCCGAPAEWSGRVDLFRKTGEAFLQHYVEMGSRIQGAPSGGPHRVPLGGVRAPGTPGNHRQPGGIHPGYPRPVHNQA